MAPTRPDTGKLPETLARKKVEGALADLGWDLADFLQAYWRGGIESIAKQKTLTALHTLGWDANEFIDAYSRQGKPAHDYNAAQQRAALRYLKGEISRAELQRETKIKTDGALFRLIDRARSTK